MSPVVLIIISSAVVLIGAALISLFIGKSVKTKEDWAVGGRSLPIYVIIGSQYATAMGGGMLVAHVGIAYKSGWSALTYGILASSVFLVLTIIAKWLRTQEFTTIPDIIEKVYGENKLLTIIAIIMTIIVPFGWICTQLVAFAKLYSSLTGVSMVVLIVVFAIISLAYVLPAGLASVAWTDFIFGCLMIVMSIVSVVFVTKMGGGIDNIVNNVPKDIWQFPGSMKAVGGYTIALWALAILPGGITNQMSYQRIFAVDNVKKVRISLVVSAFVIVTGDVWASFMGISIRSLNPNLAPEMAAGWFLSQVPVWFMAIYSGFLVATIMSTIDSAVQSIVVNLTTDVYNKVLDKGKDKKTDDKKILKLSRILCVVVTALAVCLSIFYPNALSWLVATYAYSASALLSPIFVGYFLKDKNFLTAKGAIGSMICGTLGCVIAQVMNSSIPYVFFGLISSFFGLVIISYLTNKNVNSEMEIQAE
ncbi:sodium:solute symporter family protein [Clostridium oceanicum]|uniref:Sodium:solute symporter family protein n=1 Tax=Clostridium oceanicum TaxID=1543 RepID=A0ABN1JF70_9CLOT